jgi:hypothetical protein
LAKSFAEAMGGRLTVHSILGEGSAFTIHLLHGTHGTGFDRPSGPHE